MAGLIDWGNGTGGGSLPSGRIDWTDAYDAANKASAAQAAQNRRVQQSQQQEQQQLRQQQQQPKQSFLSKTLGFAKTAVADTGKAVRAVARPIADVGGAIGQEIQNKPVTDAGKFVHDSAQLSSDVSGGTVNQFAKAVVNTPAIISREIQNKPVTDIQQKTFGTTKPVEIAKKIAGSTVGTASLFVGGGETKAATKGAQAAKDLVMSATKTGAAGAAGAAGATVTQNPNASAQEIARSAAIGGAAGAVIPVAGHVAGKVAGAATTAAGKNKSLNDLLATTKTSQVVQKTADAGTLGKEAIAGAKTEHVPVTDTSVPTPGKAALIDAPTYSKLSNKLSKAYDQESGALKDKGPVIQQKMQGEIDAKYQDLQDKLDESAGKTKVTFDEPKAASQTPLTDKTTVTPTQPLTKPAPKAAEPNVIPEGKVSGTPAVQPSETVKVPQEQLPMGTGKEKLSRFAARMQGDINNLTDEQKAAIPTYKELNNKENIQAAAMYVDKHPNDVMPILLGEKAPPPGIHHTSIYLAAKAKGNLEDPDLAQSLTSLAATRHGQEISLLREANPNDPITHMSDLRNTKIEAKGGEAKVRARATTEVTAIRTATPKVTKDSWSNFVESLRC